MVPIAFVLSLITLTNFPKHISEVIRDVDNGPTSHEISLLMSFALLCIQVVFFYF